MKEKIAVVGSGEYANQIRDFIENYSDYEFAGFIDNNVNEESVLCDDDHILDCFSDKKFDKLFMGVGYANFKLRSLLFEKFKNMGFSFATLIHPTAFVHCKAHLGEGCYVGPNSVVLKDAILEENVGLMTNVLVGHNDHIGTNTYIAGMAALAGYVEIGACCFIGLNSTFRDHAKVADNTTIGCASNVVKDILEPNHTYAGNPAKLIR